MKRAIMMTDKNIHKWRREMKKVLYVHGLGGSRMGETYKNLSNSLAKYGIEVISFDFPNEPFLYREAIMEAIKKENVCYAVASSLGAFMTLHVIVMEDINIPTILINPALSPYLDISKNFGYGIKEYRKPRMDKITTYELNEK